MRNAALCVVLVLVRPGDEYHDVVDHASCLETCIRVLVLCFVGGLCIVRSSCAVANLAQQSWRGCGVKESGRREAVCSTRNRRSASDTCGARGKQQGGSRHCAGAIYSMLCYVALVY